MVDSTTVLWGQALAYTFYVLAMMAVMAWFAFRVTQQGEREGIRPAVFYSFAGFLVVCGVSLHIITYNTIPWTPLDLERGGIQADREFTITVEQHKFIVPEGRITAACNEKVRFSVVSKDLTYGFGLFRPDNSMVFQMQVLPGHVNDVLWQFDRAGVYSIRSTEYSGPAGIGMIVPDAVVVTCDDKTVR
jgi:cytochrome c oxidase subunit 2